MARLFCRLKFWWVLIDERRSKIILVLSLIAFGLNCSSTPRLLRWFVRSLSNSHGMSELLAKNELAFLLNWVQKPYVSLGSLRLLSLLISLLLDQDLLPKGLLKSMYVSFLAGCFRSVRFGLQEAHGWASFPSYDPPFKCCLQASFTFTYISRKGQALHFNWLYDKGAFLMHPDETFSVDFSKVQTFQNL